METPLPYLDVTSPDGDSFQAEISSERVTVGRFPEHNDIALQPDPQQLVTRIAHCAIERDASMWWVVDNGSVNKTFLCCSEIVSVVDGRELLHDGDTIRVLGRLSETGDPSYWELTFHDPMRTRPAVVVPVVIYLAYDWLQAKLLLVEGRERHEVSGLRPQEHKLIRYMDQRNKANGYSPVMCGYDELIEAIWGEDAYGHAEADISCLVWELRSKIERDAREPGFLQTVRRLGYRLLTRPLAG